MELKLHHVNYSTKDVGAVAEFYRSLFNMKPVPSYGDARITSEGYAGKVEFLTDGTTEFHISPQDLGVAFRTGQSLNPVDRGHIAFRTDDLEAVDAREADVEDCDIVLVQVRQAQRRFSRIGDVDGKTSLAQVGRR